jgi:hypothetical protein
MTEDYLFSKIAKYSRFQNYPALTLLLQLVRLAIAKARCELTALSFDQAKTTDVRSCRYPPRLLASIVQPNLFLIKGTSKIVSSSDSEQKALLSLIFHKCITSNHHYFSLFGVFALSAAVHSTTSLDMEYDTSPWPVKDVSTFLEHYISTPF